MSNQLKHSSFPQTRVLVVAQNAATVATLTAEMMSRSALVAVATNVAEAGAASRTTSFDTIFVSAREADAETALLIQLLRGASCSAPKIVFLVDPLHLEDHPESARAADETATWAIAPEEIADIAIPRSPSNTSVLVDVAAYEAKPKVTAPSPATAAPSPVTAARELAVAPVVEPAAAPMLVSAPAPIVVAPAAVTQVETVPAEAAPTVTTPVAATTDPIVIPLKVEETAKEDEAPPAAPQQQIMREQVMLTPDGRRVTVMVSDTLAPAPVQKEADVEEAAEQGTPLEAQPAPSVVQPVSASITPVADATAPVAASALAAHEGTTPAVVTEAPAVKAENAPRRRFYDQKEDTSKKTLSARLSKFGVVAGWAAFAMGIVGLTTWPISTQAQFMLGLSALGVMTVIRKLRLTGVFRYLFLSLGITMILRYVYWRTTATLPAVHDWTNFAPGFLLYIAEMYCVMMFFISMFVIADPVERKPPPNLPDDRLPTVDIFVPSYNEGADLLSATLAAASQIDYPKEKFNIYLLDDGGTDQKCNQSDPEKAAEARARRVELQALCAELEVNYLTRAKNEHAKAGNMNSALKQTNGQIIVVFDADHAPARQFLRETVGYFSQDRKLFLVQTPHFFINPDPVEKNLQTFDKMPSENEMFYGTIQKGLDKWNGAFFCGSAALLARRALDSVGGFSGISITEDCETALDLHTNGWNSLYVDKPLIAGLQPESLVSFIGQRSRWCRGMIQILVLKNPLLKKNISLKQRIAYISSMFYWIFPIPRMIFLLSPFLYIFFNMQIFSSNAQEFFAYVTFYMLTHMSIQNYLYGSTRWPWVSEAYEFVQSIYLVMGIWGVLLNPRKPTFNVTAKGLTLDNDHLSELAWPYFVAFGAILTSLVVACWRFLSENEVNELLIIVGGWSFYNLIIAGVALGIVAERRERRKTPRLKIERKGELTCGEISVPVKIADCSVGGMRVIPATHRLPESFKRGNHCTVRVIPERENFVTLPIPCVLRGVTNDGNGAAYGLQFNSLSPIHYRGIADAMYADAGVFENFRSGRRKIKGITMGTFQFMWWSINHTIRAFYYAIALRKPAQAEQEESNMAESSTGNLEDFAMANPQVALAGASQTASAQTKKIAAAH